MNSGTFGTKTYSYLVGPYYTGPKLTPTPSMPAVIGVIFQMFTVKLS